MREPALRDLVECPHFRRRTNLTRQALEQPIGGHHKVYNENVKLFIWAKIVTVVSGAGHSFSRLSPCDKVHKGALIWCAAQCFQPL